MVNIPVSTGGGSATEQQVVDYITQQWGAAKAAQFKKWYAAALAKDPGLSPSQAGAIWIVGEGLATGIGKVGGFTAVQVPTAAAGAAAKATHSIPNPLSGLDAIGAFFATLTQQNTWIRILKIVFGGVLLLAGIVKMTGATDKLAALGPVGMVTSKIARA